MFFLIRTEKSIITHKTKSFILSDFSAVCNDAGHVAVANTLHISSELLLCGVLETGYQVKESLLSEKLGRLREEDRQEIYDVTESMLKHKKPER